MMAILWVCLECLFLVSLYVAFFIKHPDVPLFAKCGVFVVFVACGVFFALFELDEFVVKLVPAKNKSQKGKR